jgi:glycosyltransferase involved in cell wall biosynthesis
MNASFDLQAASVRKIALFLPSLRGGGAERVTVNLAKGFLEKGFQVDLVLAKAEGPYLKQVPEGARVVDLGTGRVFKALIPLARYLRRERPWALIAGISHANVTAILASLFSRVRPKLLVVEHCTLSSATDHAVTLRARSMHLFMRLLYPLVDRVVAVSRGVKDDLMQTLGLPEKQIEVIYNPILDADLFSRAAEPVDHPWFQEDQPPVVLSVGRLEYPKDFATLLRAFAIVHRTIPCRCVILGEGPDRPQIEALAEELGVRDDLWMPGFVDNPYAYMSKSKVQVLSSHWEGLPTVLVEASACGTPILATDCPSGPREIIRHGDNGLLVPVGDEKSMAVALIEVLNGQLKAKRSSLSRFELSESTKKYLKVLGN